MFLTQPQKSSLYFCIKLFVENEQSKAILFIIHCTALRTLFRYSISIWISLCIWRFQFNFFPLFSRLCLQILFNNNLCKCLTHKWLSIIHYYGYLLFYSIGGPAMNEGENAFDYYYCSMLDEYNSMFIFFFFFMFFFAVKYEFLLCHCYIGSNGAYMCAHTRKSSTKRRA